MSSSSPPLSATAFSGEGSNADQARALVEQARARAQNTEQRRAAERARDGALVDKARKGDLLAFRSLVEAHQNRLFGVALGMLKDRDEAKDVVQEVLIKVHQKLGDFEGNAAFSTWIYRICVNLCIDKKRAHARRHMVSIDDVGDGDVSATPGSEGGGDNPLRALKDKELGAQIGRALATLSPEHRAVVLLREIEGMSYEEISQVLEIPKGTVMSRLFHARKLLQEQLRAFADIAGGSSDGAVDLQKQPSEHEEMQRARRHKTGGKS